MVLKDLPNIGRKITEKLAEVGIFTEEDLQRIGSKEAFLRIRQIDSTVCYNMLCALEGAIQGQRWHNLSKEDKEKLKNFYDQLK